jgi:hypothetical protein
LGFHDHAAVHRVSIKVCPIPSGNHYKGRGQSICQEGLHHQASRTVPGAWLLQFVAKQQVRLGKEVEHCDRAYKQKKSNLKPKPDVNFRLE